MSESKSAGPTAIRHVVVLGANGTMGYGAGALFTTAVSRVTFLARTREKAEKGLTLAVNQVRSPTVRNRAEVGDYGADLERVLADADLVFEAVAEDLAVKRELFARVDAARSAHSIIATGTSGLSVAELAAGRSDSFRKHFLGLHLFNPPNTVVGTELIGSPETEAAALDAVEAFATRQLGRAVVRTADTPAFAGNRIGFKVLNEVAQLAEEHGVLLMDRLVGPYTGRAMGPLATIDLVGWEIHKAIVDNICAKTHDEAHETLRLPPRMAALLASGTRGAKSGGGYFKTKKGEAPQVLDLATGDYLPVADVKLPDLGFVRDIAELHRVGRYAEALDIFATAPGDEAALARRVVAGYIAYAYARVGEVAGSIGAIDTIMAQGFNWAPPSALVDLIGARRTLDLVTQAGLRVPEALQVAAGHPPAKGLKAAALTAGRYFVAA